MEWIRQLRMIKRHQSYRLTQSSYRNSKTHVYKDPANQRSKGPKQSTHHKITNYPITKPLSLLKHNLLLIQRSNPRQGLDGHVQHFQSITPALERFLD